MRCVLKAELARRDWSRAGREDERRGRVRMTLRFMAGTTDSGDERRNGFRRKAAGFCEASKTSRTNRRESAASMRDLRWDKLEST